MDVSGIAVMRRRSDGWLNATQILKVAGVDKGKRTKVLEKEILTGEHEKVQGGYGKYQGTWISYKRGREFCRQYGVEDILRPLLDYDVSSDGSGGQGEGQKETPTKEQAMAANRKRFYNPSSGEAPRPSTGTLTNGTLFSGSTASAALSAINKAARLNSPAPRPGSSFRRPDDPLTGGSQQSMVSDGSFQADGKYHDSGYSTQMNGEPPRKRLRADSTDGMASGLPIDASMRSATPTEPNESFLYDTTMMSQEHTNSNGDPVALPPLPSPTSDEQQEKMALILDLFAENAGQTDYASHPALQQLSGEDLNTPLDASANNALHWAATLAKVPLLKLLVQRGANIHRGNAVGQSPLISAVLVNNSWERSCFPDMLEILGGLIEVRDSQGRTILHHIAVSSGINGRGKSSKYYLEALLEFLVRIGTQPNLSSTSAAAATIANNIQAHNGDISMSQASLASNKGAVSLVRFLSHIVNARDKAGNTALNLVARIGNRSIIQQLLEIHADPTLPNYKGVSAKDFGVGVEFESQPFTQSTGGISAHAPDATGATQETLADAQAEDATATADQVEDQSQSLLASMTELLNQSLASHKDLLKQKSEQIDQLNAQIQELSNFHKTELEKVTEMKERVRARDEKQAKITALRRALAEKKKKRKSTVPSPMGEDAWLIDPSSSEILSFDSSGTNGTPNPIQRTFLANNVPPSSQLRSSISAYAHQNTQLQQTADDLKARSAGRQAMYRRVVALCTSVEEARVEESLPGLLAAVESERGFLGGNGGDGESEVRRVREFLRKVEPGIGGGMGDGGGV